MIDIEMIDIPSLLALIQQNPTIYMLEIIEIGAISSISNIFAGAQELE